MDADDADDADDAADIVDDTVCRVHSPSASFFVTDCECDWARSTHTV